MCSRIVFRRAAVRRHAVDRTEHGAGAGRPVLFLPGLQRCAVLQFAETARAGISSRVVLGSGEPACGRKRGSVRTRVWCCMPWLSSKACGARRTLSGRLPKRCLNDRSSAPHCGTCAPCPILPYDLRLIRLCCRVRGEFPTLYLPYICIFCCCSVAIHGTFRCAAACAGKPVRQGNARGELQRAAG